MKKKNKIVTIVICSLLLISTFGIFSFNIHIDEPIIPASTNAGASGPTSTDAPVVEEPVVRQWNSKFLNAYYPEFEARCVLEDGNRLIVAGSACQIFISEDGEKFTLAPFREQIDYVFGNNDYFSDLIRVGDYYYGTDFNSGVWRFNYDFTTYEQVWLSYKLTSICYNGEIFYTIGSNSVSGYSYDGYNWVDCSPESAINAYDACVLNGNIYLYATNKVFYSFDSKYKELKRDYDADKIQETAFSINAINDKLYVGCSGGILYVRDLAAKSNSLLLDLQAESYRIYDVVCHDGKLYACGVDETNQTGFLYTSLCLCSTYPEHL